MQRIARVEQIYALRPIMVGETFEVEPQDVEILLRLGRIDPQEGEQGYVASDIGPVPDNRAMTAHTQERPRNKRPYHRKAA